MTEKMKRELEEIFNDPLLAWVNEDSVKRMSEVVRDVFPKATKSEINDYLEKFWDSAEDTPETLYKKLMDSKVS